MINIRQGTNDDAYTAFYANSHMEGRYTAYIRGKRCGSVSDFMKEYSAAFQFPAYFGENWNAWDECMRTGQKKRRFRAKYRFIPRIPAAQTSAITR